jgi:adenosylcobyric acid synthase
LHDLHLDAEDAISTEQVYAGDQNTLRVIVPVFSRISNHTEFDVLRLHPQVDLQFIGPGAVPPEADLIILPGSKNVRMDLQWLRDNGWQQAISRHLRYGGKLIGICGGFQMLGQHINDPLGIEGEAGSSTGLGLLEMSTNLEAEKQLHQVTGTLSFDDALVKGYEIHCGVSTGKAMEHCATILSDGTPEGALSQDGQIMGTYLHGIFDHPQAGEALIRWAGLGESQALDIAQIREQQLDRLADVLEKELDCSVLFPGVF